MKIDVYLKDKLPITKNNYRIMVVSNINTMELNYYHVYVP